MTRQEVAALCAGLAEPVMRQVVELTAPLAARIVTLEAEVAALKAAPQASAESTPPTPSPRQEDPHEHVDPSTPDK